jgi:ADP-heptose:LPS heptosyltransferase
LAATTLSPRAEKVLEFVSPLLGRMAGADHFSLPGDVSDASRVLVVDSGDLTELLFFAPVLGNLKHRFPGMRVSVLVREGNGELVRTMEQINEMISYEPEHLSLVSTTYLSLLRRVRSREFDVVFLLGRDFNFARSLAALWSRARVRVGFSQRFSYPFVNCEVRRSGQSHYEADRSMYFLNALGLTPGDNLPGWKLPDQDIKWADRLIHFRDPDKNRMLVAVDPGMGKGRHRLVEKSFLYMVSEICTRHPSKVIVLSNNLDEKQLRSFRASLDTNVIDLAPKNVKEALALMSRADLVLSGNTDFFHFAVSMRLPTLGFFTGHDGENWFPKSTPWVQIIQGVRGQKLSLDEVFSKIDTLLHLTRA